MNNANENTERYIKLCMNKIESNIRWLNASFNELSNWLLTNQNSVTENMLDYRLPTNIIPYHYDLLVNVQLVNTSGTSFPYEAEVKIELTCINDTTLLIFHIEKLIIDNSTISLTSSTDSQFGKLEGFSWYNDFERNFFIANLSKPFKAQNNYTLYIKYTGFLADDNVGFYRSSYVDSQGIRKWLMTSKLEPTYARKSWPCFDEPAIKATYKITAIHQNDYYAMSNMPVDSVEPL